MSRPACRPGRSACFPTANLMSDIRNATVCSATLVLPAWNCAPSCDPQVVGDLVDHQEGRLVADQLLPDLRARRRPLLVALADDLVGFGPSTRRRGSQLPGNLAPEREGANVAVVDTSATSMSGPTTPAILCDWLRASVPARRSGATVFRIDAAPAEVVEGDQIVRLAAAEARLQANDRGAGGLRAGQPAQSFAQQRLAARWSGRCSRRMSRHRHRPRRRCPRSTLVSEAANCCSRSSPRSTSSRGCTSRR